MNAEIVPSRLSKMASINIKPPAPKSNQVFVYDQKKVVSMHKHVKLRINDVRICGNQRLMKIMALIVETESV